MMGAQEELSMPNVGDLPEPLHSTPVDLKVHWTVLDQTKAEFKKSGRSGVVIFNDPDDEYRAKLSALLAKFDTQWNMKKPYLVIEHATQAEALFKLALAAGLRAELILAG
jgi:hypothetical protein